MVQPLVHAALTSGWRPALNLLYFHGTLLALSEEIGLPVMVSVRGDTIGLDQVSELMKAKTTSEMSRIARSWSKQILPVILQTAQETKGEISPGEIGALLGARAAREEGPFAKLFQDLLKKGFEDAVTFSGGLAALVFEFLLTKRASYLTNVLAEPEYEKMVDRLARLGILEPRLEVSICLRCHNHYFVVSSSPATSPSCTKCGRAWVTVELYVFRQPYSQAELGSSLMALFISAYLREKVNSQSPVIDLEVYPNAEFKLGDDKVAEVDVYVPRAAAGYECKAFEDVFAPLTGNRLGSVTGRVLDQIDLYLSLGIKRIVIATNLPSSGAERVERELSKKLDGKKTRPASLLVVPGNPEALIKHLDIDAESLAKLLNDDFGKSFNARSSAKNRRRPPRPPGLGSGTPASR